MSNNTIIGTAIVTNKGYKFSIVDKIETDLSGRIITAYLCMNSKREAQIVFPHEIKEFV